MPFAFSSCWIKNFEINKDIIYLYSGGYYRWSSRNPYEKIKITANKIIQDNNNDVLLWSSLSNIYADLVLSWNAFSWLLSKNLWWNSLYLKNITFPESVTWLINGTNNYWLIEYFSWTLTIPWHIKTIWYNTFNGNRYLKNVIFEEWVEEIWDNAFYMSNYIENIKFSKTIKSIWNKSFAFLNKAKELTIPWNIKKIWDSAFESAIILENLNLWEWIEEIGERAFWAINREIKWIYIPDSIKRIWFNAFCKDIYDSVNWKYIMDESRITWYITKDISQEWIDNETCMNFIRQYKIEFTWDSNLITIPERQILDLSWNVTEPEITNTKWYEFKWWYKIWETEAYNFKTEVNENLILEARLSKIKYNVNYTNIEWIENTIVEYKENIPLPTPKEREWYIFKWREWIPKNWIMPAHDIILTWIWEKFNSTPSAWGWSTITPNKQETKSIEKEHNSAETKKENETVTKKITLTNKTNQSVEENIKNYSNIKLTRWEVAVLTNILLGVFPQLVEWKQELDDVENACSNYVDEQKFTKDEKKAITRLCKLSIMWIHADNNKPLDEFMVNEWTKNDEFSKVINRSISTYNEKDFSTVKDALKKLENNDDDVVFWTLYDMFMSIKNVLN